MADLTEMDRLIAKALKALEESSMDEIELSDGTNKVRVVRSSPAVNYYPSYPWAYHYQFPTYPYGGANY